MSVRVTWWGHATMLVEDGARVLTDPVLTAPFRYLRRRAGVKPDATLLRPDVVLISHLHGDHLHLPSLRRLPVGTLVVVPRGAGGLLAGLDVTIQEVEVGDQVHVADVRVLTVHAQHDGGRSRVSRVRGSAVGYVIKGSARTYFAGDTGRFGGMAELAPVDVALIPVGGWGPTLGRGDGHLDPEQAAEALSLLRPSVAVPMHYGTFWPRLISWFRPERFSQPAQQFAERAKTVAPDVDVRVLPPASSTVVEI
jgi:L-ascorbate metabolism protein UlaG (beta-lactamase superfamily)